jgi:hypothetical protein
MRNVPATERRPLSKDNPHDRAVEEETLMTNLTRRQFVGATAALAASIALPGMARAQDGQTIRLGMAAA